MIPFIRHAVVVALIAVSALPAMAASNYKERKGGQDHPLVSRYQGAILHNYGVINFDQVKVPLSEKKDDLVEGRIYNYFYLTPPGRSELEVFRTYKMALEKGGFTILVACEDERECERQKFYRNATEWTDKPATWVGGYDPLSRIDQNGNYPPRYLAARLKRPAGDVTVMLTIHGPSSTQKDSGVGGPYFLQVVEAKAMETGNVTVNADAIAKGLAADGKLALYGIFFDTGKADIKPESNAQLAEMAKLMSAQKAMKVYIVGHTDNQGTLEANLALSQKRADAIVAALVKDYKVDAKRMQARGTANLAPLASNASEAGRARNRRVELVEQ